MNHCSFVLASGGAVACSCTQIQISADKRNQWNTQLKDGEACCLDCHHPWRNHPGSHILNCAFSFLPFVFVFLQLSWLIFGASIVFCFCRFLLFGSCLVFSCSASTCCWFAISSCSLFELFLSCFFSYHRLFAVLLMVLAHFRCESVFAFLPCFAWFALI